MVKTRRHAAVFFGIFGLLVSFDMRADSSWDTFVKTADIVQSAFFVGYVLNYFDRSNSLWHNSRKFAPQYVQDCAAETYQRLESLCKEYGIVGQFAGTSDKKKPTVYFNIDLGPDPF